MLRSVEVALVPARSRPDRGNVFEHPRVPCQDSRGGSFEPKSLRVRVKERTGWGLVALLLLLPNCEGQDTASPSWVSLPATLSDGAVITLIGVDSGLCIEIGGTGNNDRDAPQLAACTGATGQQFRLAHKSAGFFQLANVNSSKCLDVDSASMTFPASAIQWPCNDGSNQQVLIQNRGSLAQLRMRHSGMCLDAKGAGKEPGTPIIQWPCTDSLNQLFWIEPPAHRQPTR
jgi:ricin-type beta-trefoil lectin protein